MSERQYVTVSVHRHRWPATFKLLKKERLPLRHINKSGAVVSFETTAKALELLQVTQPGAVVER